MTTSRSFRYGSRVEPAGSRRTRAPNLLVALLVLVALLLVPYAFKPYAANALALFLIYGLLAMSLNFIWGQILARTVGLIALPDRR